jgi:hypothetical protein
MGNRSNLNERWEYQKSFRFTTGGKKGKFMGKAWEIYEVGV